MYALLFYKTMVLLICLLSRYFFGPLSTYFLFKNKFFFHLDLKFILILNFPDIFRIVERRLIVCFENTIVIGIKVNVV